jgi:hypothetical protein
MSEKTNSEISENVLWFENNGIKSRDLEAFLQATGTSLQPVPLKSKIPSGPGLFLFKSVTDELCDALRNLSRYCTRILAVTFGEKPLDGPDCWRLLSTGASDVVVWSDDVGLETIQSRLERWQEIDRIVFSSQVSNYAIGTSKIWLTVLRDIVELACFTDSSVLIMGETGTGKELVSNLIHTLDRRKFSAMNEVLLLMQSPQETELSLLPMAGHYFWTRWASSLSDSRKSFSALYRNIPTKRLEATPGSQPDSG